MVPRLGDVPGLKLITACTHTPDSLFSKPHLPVVPERRFWGSSAASRSFITASARGWSEGPQVRSASAVSLSRRRDAVCGCTPPLQQIQGAPLHPTTPKIQGPFVVRSDTWGLALAVDSKVRRGPGGCVGLCSVMEALCGCDR